MSTIQVNVYQIFPKTEQLTFSNVDLSASVAQLRAEVTKHLPLPGTPLDIIYCGECLKAEQSMDSYGIKPGSTLHAVPKIECETMNRVQESPSPNDTVQLVRELRRAVRNPAYRNIVHSLSKPDALENIIVATPGLAHDHFAIALLQDLDLILYFSHQDTLPKIISKHPAFGEALNHIVAALHDEAGLLSVAPSNTMPAAYSYSVDALSDDENEPSASEEQAGHGSSQQFREQPTFQGITSAQLALALATVTSSGNSVGTANMPSSSGTQSANGNTASGGNSTSVAGVITPEMLSRAIEENLNAPRQNQLQGMGIVDDVMSLQALGMESEDAQAMQAALELIFEELTETDNQDQPPSS